MPQADTGLAPLWLVAIRDRSPLCAPAGAPKPEGGAAQAKGLTRTPMVGLDEWVAKEGRTQAAFKQMPALWDLVARVAIHAYRVPTYMKPAATRNPDLRRLCECECPRDHQLPACLPAPALESACWQLPHTSLKPHAAPLGASPNKLLGVPGCCCR